MNRLAGKTSQLLLFFAFSSLLSEASVKLSKTPSKFSHRSSPLFAFDVSENECSSSNCSFTCKLDNGIASKCESKRISYSNLLDGKHTFEVCTNNNGLQRLDCVTYNWTIDTVPPTANITAANPFTNALNFSVNVSFSEPCIVNGGFSCLSANACNVLVYGAGRVIPASLTVLEKNLKYSLAVSLSPEVSYGRVILAMDKDFCSDIAGNRFARTANSTFFLHYDRRSVFVNVRVHIPERLVELSGKTRTVLATNDERHLRAYLYFSEPILNSSAEILDSVRTSQGKLVPIHAQTIGNRRFGFLIENVHSVSVVTLSVESRLIISRPGTPVSPVLPTTFLFDSKRPSVKLSTTSSLRTRDHNIPIAITFVKPVFDFNSSHVSILGGRVKSFHQISRSRYILGIQASEDAISVHVPENVTGDVSGNKNLASNVLQVRHYSVPLVSLIASGLVTCSFLATCLVSGFLSFSTSSLQTVWTFKGPSSLRTDPARNLFRIACHIQVFAFSRWLAVMLPVEFYEFAIGLQWSVPYFHLPWESGHPNSVMVGTSPFTSAISDRLQPTQVFGLPLDPMEYRFYFENPNSKPEAEVLMDPHNRNGWTNFERSMFWLALITGTLVLLHIILLSLLKLRKKSPESSSAGFGALTFPRLEIFLIILALPCLSQVSSALLNGKDTSGVIVGISMLSVVAILLMSLFGFLSYGVTCARLLQYKEVQREGSTWRWYRELVRVTLGPGKRGQWTWKKKSPRSLLALGPMFEDLRGPPKYMLSQIIAGDQNNSTTGKSAGDRIIASDDETEDAEAPAIQKLFGILRIYYTLLECAKRVLLGVMAGIHMQDSPPSRSPATALLCLTLFQLFFLLLKKPFIKKRVQLMEILSVSAEAALFAACLGLKSSPSSLAGVLMVLIFFVWFVPQMGSEWWALYGQVRLLDPEERSVARGVLIALVGSALVFLPRKWVDGLERKFSKPRIGQSRSQSQSQSQSRSRSTKSSSQGSAGSAEKPWLRQLREMAKASFSREGNGGANEASTSRSGGWSGLWGSKKSGSSPGVGNVGNNKSNKGLLYKDLEDIFAAK